MSPSQRSSSLEKDARFFDAVGAVISALGRPSFGKLGRLGTAICYDWLFPEAIRALALAGAEVLIRVSAYVDPWGATPPLALKQA